MQQIDIFGLSPKRSAAERAVHLSKPVPAQGYGFDYFDNPAYVGYGGYTYDGRYRGAAIKMTQCFGLMKGDRVLEIGGAKGFILYEFFALGMDVIGLDASEYAVANAKEEIRDRMRVHSSPDLPFADKEFDFVLAKEVVPHLPEKDALRLIQEIGRVGKKSFLELQCADTPESAALMKRWDQSHQTIKPSEWWISQLKAVGYEGAYNCRQLF